jgi:hypothetical protein
VAKPKKKPGVAALLRDLPGVPRGSTEDVDVSALVRDLGAMIDAARKQVLPGGPAEGRHGRLNDGHQGAAG